MYQFKISNSFILVTPLERTLKIELFSKDVGLNLLHVGRFTIFLSCLVYSGEGIIIVSHPVQCTSNLT